MSNKSSLSAFIPNRRRVFFPVIHVHDDTQAQQSAEVAMTCGADGVWLINHGYLSTPLMQVASKSRGDFRSYLSA